MNDLYEIGYKVSRYRQSRSKLLGNSNDSAKNIYLRYKKEKGSDVYNYYWQRSRKRTLKDKIWFKRQFE